MLKSLRALGRSAIILLPAGLLACSGVLAPAGPVAANENMLLFDSLALMLVIVVPTIAATLGFAWWFRASNAAARRTPDWNFSGRIELMVWSVPALTIMFLGGMAWIAAHRLDPYRPLPSRTKALEVEVVSLDWKWLFIYPEQGIASVNEMVAPAGVPIHFTLTSASVMNAFFVPQLGSMIYTMNGMTTQLNLQADRPGIFAGLSSHFSGDGFSGMHFNLRVTTPGGFAAWIAAARAGSQVLDAQAYERLQQQSSNVIPFTYRAAVPGLFQSIVTQAISPGPGPALATPAKTTSPQRTR